MCRMKFFTMICIFVVSLSAQTVPNRNLHQEDRELYNVYFDRAGEEFGVPSDILRGLSFSETRWTHMVWNDDDLRSSCTGIPRVYGVMGLWDNDYFGFSLREAAALIGKEKQELKESPYQNIRGAAALLKKYYSEVPKPNNTAVESIESWQNAVAKFCGFPQEEIAQRRSLEVYSILASGYQRDRIVIKKREIDLAAVKKNVQAAEDRSFQKKSLLPNSKIMNQPDYPLAKWNPAYSGNFGTQLISQKFVVIHDVEGSYLGCISWFQNPSAQVSSQYVLNSHPNGVNASTKSPNGTPDAPVGEVTQMVEEKYRAWHVGCWNSYMIGIEHEGYYNVTGWYTPECYESSSNLVRYLCDKYNIPKDRNHVIAHQEWQNAAWRSWVTSTGQGFDPNCNTHVDPGQNWNWTQFMSLITKADTVRPVITKALPQSNILSFPAYKDIVIEFNTPMDITSTNTAFSIAPSVPGVKTWNTGNTILTFNPTATLPWNTSFTVTIDTSAKNIAKSRNLGITPFIASFITQPLDTLGPHVLRSSPMPDETDVFTTTDVAVFVDEAVQTSSLSTTVKMVDNGGANIPLANAKNEILYDRSVISFTPSGLKANTTYTVKILAGVKDYYGNPSKDDVLFQFTTGSSIVTAGLVLDNFDANTKGWLQPNQSGLTAFIDSNGTQFLFSTEKVRNGSAAKLSYSFTQQNGGVAAVQATGFPPIDMYSTVGVWIFGDASGNLLELVFSPNDQVVPVGKIFWRGWRFFQFQISEITGPNKKLKSIVIRQNETGDRSGVLFFDDMQLDATVTGHIMESGAVPQQFQLKQNFPNPFNPTTEIQFIVPDGYQGNVKLDVFDALGRTVSTLVNGSYSSGSFAVQFDASHLPSGVYFYRLRAGEFVAVNRMLLMK